ncbi:Rne/Rng family ribonuclease [Limoniibacter endophyticus]|uniref:Ribonuclease E n=1 Tax=Limoniibacter endophyticus TaxID=1565040 RepID=A0A8J3DF71_9HYPH|nr:ribonuclease E/G [Limoniibacter endophyticus]GHC63126.1 ribonuclease E [Limoniibacter endophyticus]
MPNKMLIDASHPEETRVVVTHGNRIEEFDFESQDKKQLKGNIYLARVTRVEPSLQAAFVEYGGNRHGFLAFSEIHPDYYQIPHADRQALLEAEEADNRENGDDELESDQPVEATAVASGEADGEGEEKENGRTRRRRRARQGKRRGNEEMQASSENGTEEEGKAIADAGDAGIAEGDASDEIGSEESGDPDVIAAEVEHDSVSEPVEPVVENGDDDDDESDEGSAKDATDQVIESVGAEDVIEEARERRKPLRRHYKIQEVIKRRQILLVQVVKEERGNKGAALTTYLSLAGRYSVLMPNTARGGGISRKITNAQTRKRMKEMVQELDVPKGMGVILRTAGENRTKPEIKRDYEYLMRMWDTVRDTTLQSTAPALVYEEGSLIKRSIRDLYNKDIDQILVSGEEGYKEAKSFMRMLMPSHAKVVQPFRDTVPIFARSGIEAQLDKMLQPQVTLKSGGYIIINQTEALVAIDVNSGRSTKEHSIEDTALQTNLEAAEEVARQLRLRDLAGLIVIDFIDMEESRNNRAVEKRLKDCLKNDRARIQVGRISPFGLLEMSRQRIRASVLESTMKVCPHCGGTGHVRSDSSVALLVVRAIEEFLLKDSRSHITVRTPTETALYILNHKRASLVDLENRFLVQITLEADETLGTQHYAIIRGASADKPEGWTIPTMTAEPIIEEDEDDNVVIEPFEGELEVAGTDIEQPAAAGPDENGENGGKRRKRRRRRRGRDRDREQQNDENGAVEASSEDAEDSDQDAESSEVEVETDTETDKESGKKRRRGKRGGRRHRQPDEAETAQEAVEGIDVTESTVENTDAPVEAPLVASEESAAEPAAEEEAPKKKRATRSRKKAAEAETVAEEAPVEAAPEEEAPKKKRASRSRKVAETEAVSEEASTEKPKRKAPARRKKAETAEEAVASDTVAAPAETVEATQAEVPVEPEAPAPQEETAPEAPSEPVISSNGTQAEGEQKPKKGGWWQRRGFF